MTVTDAHLGVEKIVFGFDLGTTQTAVSFVHLQDGVAPHVRLVTKWPGQEDVSGDCKIPTLVRYNLEGMPVSYGAEALENAAAEEGPIAKWFKLHLHPSSMKTNAGAGLEIPPVPQGVTLKQYMRRCTPLPSLRLRPRDKLLPRAVTRRTDYLGSSEGPYRDHPGNPNGWDLVQQAFLRDAVVAAGVLPQGHDPERLMFVSEAEASVHYGLLHTGGYHWLKPGMNFCVLDAGGSTVDTTLYKCTAITPKLELQEVTASDCVQAGSVFVDRDAEKMLRIKLAGSKYSDDEYINEIMAVFERKTKRKFDGSSDPSVIAFGRVRDNDPDFNISKGRITLSSDEVAMAFQGALYDISESFQRVLERANGACDSLLLVGGFCESPYLRKILKEKNDQHGMQTVSIDDGTKKAAAEGAVHWYLRQTVVARACRSHFGCKAMVDYKKENSRHQERASAAYLDRDGIMIIGPTFDKWCNKNDIVRSADPLSFHYFQRWSASHDMSERLTRPYNLPIYACDLDEAPYWLSEHSGQDTDDSKLMPGIQKVCVVSANLNGLRNSMALTTGKTGEKFYEFSFDVNLFFGQTALSADISWKEEGVQKKSAAQLIPESFL
ncbi:hypothetical protein BKA62DRAFT_801966 [Auriculariales sp. MPI-PUGE-AT-0066]|nr:hypothetical protein BKA62DRAFT_801966 [Auriculariales sp. MPI-PUGE-AT-0066]